MSPWYWLCVCATVTGATLISAGGMFPSAVGGFMVGTGTYLAYLVGKIDGARSLYRHGVR